MKTSFKSGTGTIFLILTIALAAAGMILYGLNSSGSYYHDFKMPVILLGILGIGIILVFIVLSRRRGEKNWMDIFYPAAGIVLMLGAIIFVSYRVESAGIILGSDLEAGNAKAMNSLIQAFVGIGCFIVASILSGVAAFFSPVKEQKE